MTQEERNLLVKDLCARSPYGVKFRYKYIDNFFHESYSTSKLEGVLPPYHIVHSTLTGDEHLKIEEDEIKPYLFPLSSMTEEQKKEINKITNGSVAISKDFFYDLCNCSKIYHFDVIAVIDWLNKSHFDYRNLIEKGLAINASNLNIY